MSEPEARGGQRRSALARWWRPVTVVALLALGAVFPLVITGQLTTYYAVLTLIFVASVVAWNLFSGYTGYISLGHAVFFGVGAYTVGLLALHNNLAGGVVFAMMPLGGLAAAVTAVPFGLVALRVRRHTFVVITIAVFFIFQLMAFNLSFTHTTAGISPPFLNWNAATFNNPFYYAAFILTAATIALSWLVRGSRFGLQLLAIRDDEDRARGLGVRPMRVKLTAFVISAFITGIAGALWMYFLGQVLPQTGFDPNFDLTIALMGFLGGFGTLWGPVLGALILEPLQQEITQNFSNAYLGELVLGVMFLLVILFLPRGLLPTIGERITAFRAWRERRDQAAAGRGGPPPAAASAAAASGPAGAPEHSGLPGTGGGR